MEMNPRNMLLSIFGLGVCIISVESKLSIEYDHAAFLDPTENFQLYWSVKDADKSIHIAVQVKTTGWVGFGISAGLSGSMKGADIAIGWVDSAGKAHIQDYHGVGNRFPVKDAKQDYELVGGSETNGQTVLKFKRKINTCDKEDKEIPLGTTKVIFAYGSTNTPQYHLSRRGSRSLNLLNYVKNSPPPATAKYFDIITANVSVPKTRTTYWCQVFKVEDIVSVKSKQHVIEIAPLVDKKFQGIVHHMVLYSCQYDFDEKHLNVTGLCYHPNMPRSVQECAGNSAVYAWAVGGVNFKFPPHVGMPLGTADSMKYLVLETHFDNPQESDKYVVSSGLRFYYDTPRKYDSGTLSTGFAVGASQIIPPKQPSWISVAQCSKECSAKIASPEAMNGKEVKFFAVFPHAHTAANGIWVKQTRNGKEIAEVFRDDNYDFDFQQTHLLRKELTFKAGDEMMTYCRYNTMKRHEATRGGSSTYDEMCLNFIMYYPRVNLTKCISFDSAGYTFATKFAKKSLTSKKRRYSNWTGIAWNASMVESLKTHYSYEHQAVMPLCTGLSGVRYGMNSVNRSTIKEKLPLHKDVCAVDSGATSIFSLARLVLASLVLLSVLFM